MPEGMPFDVADSFLMTYGTCYHALHDRAQVRPGETVLVLAVAWVSLLSNWPRRWAHA